jgi:hypothetical protein
MIGVASSCCVVSPLLALSHGSGAVFASAGQTTNTLLETHQDPGRELQDITTGCGQREHPHAVLKRELQRIWGHRRLTNESLIGEEDESDRTASSCGIIRLPTKTEQMPLSQKIVRAILAARAQEKGIPMEELTVVVAFHGGNLMEVLLWLEMGTQVIAADTSSLAGYRLRRRLKQYGYAELPRNLKIVNPYWRRRKPRGDIITACHPHISFGSAFKKTTQMITGYGMADSIYIISIHRQSGL